MDEDTRHWARGHCYWCGTARPETTVVQLLHADSGAGGSIRACRGCWEDTGPRGRDVRRRAEDAEMHERWAREDMELARRLRASG